MKHLQFLLFFSFSLQATEVVQWEKIPLPVELHVGQERIVDVGIPVRIGYPASLEGKLRLQSAGGKLFLQAHDTFPSTRIQLRDTGNGALILLDIRATQNTSRLDPLQISGTLQKSPVAENIAAPPETSVLLPSGDPLPVLLVRYAAQNLYAPLRSVEPLPGVTATSAGLAKHLTTLLPQHLLTITPLAAWKAGGLTVTALRLQNRSAQPIALDPRELQGQFIAAAFQHDSVGPRGLAEDTTVVYLVTKGSAAHALLPEPVERKP